MTLFDNIMVKHLALSVFESILYLAQIMCSILVNYSIELPIWLSIQKLTLMNFIGLREDLSTEPNLLLFPVLVDNTLKLV